MTNSTILTLLTQNLLAVRHGFEPVWFPLLTLLLAGTLATFNSFSQGVGINTIGTAPDASAMLDVSATDKGVLIPRMTTAERNAISSPANGLMIFTTDDICLGIYEDGQWQIVVCDLACSSAPATPGTITGNSSPSENSIGESYYVNQVAGTTSYTWTIPSGATVAAGQGTTGIIVDFGTTSGNITVTSNNNCGISAAQTLAITLIP